MLNEVQGDPNFGWMRAVTPEEARNCRNRMEIWANTESKPKGVRRAVNQASSFGDRVYKPLQKWEIGLGREPGLDMAQTPWCVQYMWRASMYFPLCPQGDEHSRLDAYFRNIELGSVLAYCDYEDFCSQLTAAGSALLKDGLSILVMTESKNGKWVIVGIQLDDTMRPDPGIRQAVKDKLLREWEQVSKHYPITAAMIVNQNQGFARIASQNLSSEMNEWTSVINAGDFLPRAFGDSAHATEAAQRFAHAFDRLWRDLGAARTDGDTQAAFERFGDRWRGDDEEISQTICPDCDGTGRRYARSCRRCDGTGKS